MFARLAPVPQCAAPAESPAAAASFMPSAIVFDRQGVVPASTSQARAILFRNTGDAPMNIGDVRVTGLNAGEFPIVSSDAPAVLAPGAYCTVKVAFSPSALGARQAALSFACDAVNSPTVSTPLAGTGWSGLVIASPSGPVPEIGVGTLLTPLAGNPTQGTIPVSIHWDASSTPQADHYDLQQSVNGGPFVDTAVQPGAATAVTMDLPLSSAGNPAAYLFRVRASGAGEMSNWVTGRVFAAEPVDDTNNSRVAFSGAWAPSVLAGAWGGGTRVTSARCSAELRAGAVFGSLGSIAWITTMGPDRGMVFVTVDDKDSVAVDLYAPTLQVGVVGFVATNLAAGHSHRMLIRTRALKNPLAVGVRVDADAFVVVKVPAPTAVVETNRLPGGLMSQATDLPEALSFSPIVPNPVVDRATLAFGLPRDGAVRLDVMDVQGRLVRRLADGFLPAGVHQIAWDGRGSASQAAHSGVYFAVLRFGEQTLVRRIVWMP